METTPVGETEGMTPGTTGQAAVEELSNRAVQLSNRDHLLASLKEGERRDIFSKARIYSSTIHDLRKTGVMQYGVPIESKPGPTVVMEFGGEKRSMLMFASNDYLNLSTDPRVHQAIRKTLDDYGVGAGSSRVGTGYSYLHQELEAKIADRMGREAALLFPTGYDAIASPAIALSSSDDRILIDGSSHACILDGAYGSGATVRVFAHNSVERMESALERSRRRAPEAGILVIVEGAYSMDGDIAPLPEMIEVCKKYDAQILVDEAHAVGVHGKRGYGVCEHFGVSSDVGLIGGTFSKSLGATGGFVAGDRDVVTYLNYMARKIIFSAALPPILVAGVSAAMDVMESDPSLREKLWDNVRYLAKGLRGVGANLLGTETASVPVLIANDGVMFQFTQDLVSEGIFTFPAVYPTVPKDRSTFRLALQSQHSKKDLDHTVEVFGRLLRKYGIVED